MWVTYIIIFPKDIAIMQMSNHDIICNVSENVSGPRNVHGTYKSVHLVFLLCILKLQGIQDKLLYTIGCHRNAVKLK